VNRFTEGNEEDEIETLEITGADEERQLKRLDLIRAQRDPEQVAAALAKLVEQASDDSVNLMPALVEAALAYVSLGEIMAALESVFGRHIETPSI
jgi:methylmalonyl-CoA mutase N-terminal domain/subunit